MTMEYQTPPPPGTVRARLRGCICPNERVAEEIWKTWPANQRKLLHPMTLYLIHDSCPLHQYTKENEDYGRYT